MSVAAFSGALESGFFYALLALSVFLSFRIMKIPDLTVDGSFTTGAAVSALCTCNGVPYMGLLLAVLSGMAAGAVTALLHTKLKVPAVLAGILTMTGLYSVNLRVMNGQATLSILGKNTVFSPFEKLYSLSFGNIVFPLCIVGILILLLFLFFRTRTGLAVRATGDNEVMVRSSSVNTDRMKTIALALANGLSALSGALIAQQQNYADVNMGLGAIVLGLASLIIGEALFQRKKSLLGNMISAVLGAVLYRILVAFVLQLNIKSSDLKFISAAVVVIALALPQVCGGRKGRKQHADA